MYVGVFYIMCGYILIETRKGFNSFTFFHPCKCVSFLLRNCSLGLIHLGVESQYKTPHKALIFTPREIVNRIISREIFIYITK